MTATLALLTGMTLVGGAILVQMIRRDWQRERLKGLELRPNCLLTRYPIAFISGDRSLFRIFSHWNIVPSYLREHGYDVILLEPASGRDRVPSLLAALDALESKCHLVADSSLEETLSALAQSKHPHVQSLTLIQNSARTRPTGGSLRPDDLRPLEMAVEVFDISSVPKPPLTKGWRNQVSLALLQAHNWLPRQEPVDPLETGDLFKSAHWEIESRFLDLAISLAERDTQWCDE